MAQSIPFQQLESAIQKELAAYNEEVIDGVKKEVKRVAKETVAELKQTSPKETGEYASGWSSKIMYESDDDIRIRILNKTKPHITHLLENGHARTNGGRVDGKPHIGPAEQSAEKKLDAKVKVVIRG